MDLHTFVRRAAVPLSVLAGGAFIAAALLYEPAARPAPDQSALATAVLPEAGVTLPITWGHMGARLVALGVIDPAKLGALYASRGGFPKAYRELIEDRSNDRIVMTPWNANYLLNLFWALGLANENPILDAEMRDPRYGGAGNFASTGGWTLGENADAMAYYGKFALIPLTSQEQALVDRVSEGVYRPCCGNSTHFPDCNHGMAMLGLLELMASQGISEEEMYRTALAVNSYWFPDTYLTIAAYKAQQGVAWQDVSPREVLGAAYSSAQGFAEVRSKVAPIGGESAGGCSA